MEVHFQMNSKFKKVFSFGIVLASVGLILTACSGKKSNQTANKDTKHGVALITDANGVDDHSFNQAAWAGFKAYGKEHDLKRGRGGYQYFQSSSAADYTPNFDQAAKAGYQTIFGVGFQLADAVKEAAQKNPKKNFVIVDSVVSGQKNVASATFESNQSSYLGGLAAAYTTKTNKVGFIVVLNPQLLIYSKLALNKVLQTVQKHLRRRSPFKLNTLVTLLQQIKLNLLLNQCMQTKQILFNQAAGNAGNGVFQEAKDYDQARPASKKVWVIGVDVDQSNLGNYTSKDGKKENLTLTSVLKGLNIATKSIANDAYKGKFPGGKHLVYNLKDNGVSITKGNLDAKTWAAVQKARTQIIDGKIKVATALLSKNLVSIELFTFLVKSFYS